MLLRPTPRHLDVFKFVIRMKFFEFTLAIKPEVKDLKTTYPALEHKQASRQIVNITSVVWQAPR